MRIWIQLDTMKSMIQYTSNAGFLPALIVVDATVVGIRVVGVGDARSFSAKVFFILRLDR